MSKSSIRLDQSQQLRQRLIPQQVRFGRLLEMSAPEFEDEVRRVADENPALEVRDEDGRPQDDFNESADDLMRADYPDEDEIPAYRLRDTQSHTAERFEAQTADEPDSLTDSLTSQLAETEIGGMEREIADYIIGNLDANGYLTRTPAEISDDLAFNHGIEASVDDVRRAWDAVRALDPAGIGASDLRDCLILQLRRRPASLESRTALEILTSHFDLFSKKHYDRLAAALDIPREAVDSAVALIRTLNPKPGSLLEQTSARDRLRYIVPDFIVDNDADGRLTVALNGHVPELAIEESFDPDEALSRRLGRTPDALEFIRSRRDEARDFIALARQRGETLMAVIRAIVTLQAPFFRDYDPAAIRPMVLRDVQALTGLDLSVISRATTTKYVATPHGTFPLKQFFNEAISQDDSDLSRHAVTDAMRRIIGAEDPAAPLSDAEIGRRLAEKGLGVARRTVTKYREMLGYPVARLRREKK